MPRPQVIAYPQANYHLKIGIDHLADLLAPTFGPAGGVVLNDLNGRPELLDDSATIVRRIFSLGSAQQDIGAMLLRNLVWNVGQRVGDGGAMAALLARAIYTDALRLISAGANPVLLAQGAEQAVAAVIHELERQAWQAGDESDLARMALALTQDRDLAAILGEMSWLLGPDGWVDIQEFAAPYLQRSYLAGARFRGQVASYHLYTQPAQKRAIVAQSALVLVDEVLQSTEDIVPILELALEDGATALTIVATGFSDAVSGVLVANQRALQEKCTLLAIKTDLTGETLRAAWEDLCLLSGATLLGSQYERGPRRARLEDFGQVRQLEAVDEHFVVETFSYANPAVQQAIRNLRQAVTLLDNDDEEKERLERRLASLSGGIGELKIGAYTEVERKLKQQVAERAVKILAAAQRGGVLAGGGAAYLHSLPALHNLATAESEIGMGVRLVERALSVPIKQILANSHIQDAGAVLEHVRQAGQFAAYDVIHKQLVDCREQGLVDTAETLVMVLRMATSSAMMALKTGTLVYHRKPKPLPGYRP